MSLAFEQKVDMILKHLRSGTSRANNWIFGRSSNIFFMVTRMVPREAIKKVIFFSGPATKAFPQN